MADSWRRSPGRLLHTLVALAVIALLPMAVMSLSAVAGYALFLPALNVDPPAVYAAAALVARRSVRLAAALGALLLTMVIGYQIYVNLTDLFLGAGAHPIQMLDFWLLWPWHVILPWIAAGFAFAALAYLAMRATLSRALMVWPALALIALLIFADQFRPLQRLFTTNIATSSVGDVIHNLRNPTTITFTQSPLPGMLVDQFAANPPPRILSVAVESLGQLSDPRAASAILAAMSTLAVDYRIDLAEHPAFGGTLAGELRELCGIKARGIPVHAEAEALRPHCLPDILSRQGYRTLAMHGNDKRFYHREMVYPAIGFAQTRFRGDLTRRGLPLCPTRLFDGICDKALIAEALAFLAERPNSFAHIMTIETHFPISVGRLGDARCGLVAGIDDPDLCLYLNQMSKLFSEFAQAIAAAPVKPDLIYLYGDHPPPIWSSARTQFVPKRTPFIVLTRISGETASRSNR